MSIALSVLVTIHAFQLTDDGTCEAIEDAESCNSLNPFQDYTLHICNWDDRTETCRYHTPDLSTNDLVWLMMIVLILVSPLTSIVEYLFQNILILTSTASTNIPKDNKKQNIKVHIAPEGDAGEEETDEEEEPVPVKFDEIEVNASQKSLILKAARLEKQRMEMDFDNSERELRSMIAPFLTHHHVVLPTRKKERVRVSVIAQSDSKIAKVKPGSFKKSILEVTEVYEEKDPYIVVDQNTVTLEEHWEHFSEWTAKQAKFVGDLLMTSIFEPCYVMIMKMIDLQIVSYIQVGHPRNAEHLMRYSAENSKTIALVKLNETRSRVKTIYNNVMRRSDESAKNVYLLQAFIISCIPTEVGGFAARIMYRSMGATSKLRVLSLFMTRAALACLVVILFGGLYMAASVIGIKSFDLWLLLLAASVLFDTLLVNPVKIFLVRIVFVYSVREEVVRVAGTIRHRARFIATRCAGTMASYTDLIHHFNPVCRAARTIPHLSISRLLISLNDFDLIPNWTRPSSPLLDLLVKPIIFWFRFVLDYATFMFPLLVYDLLFDLLAVTAFSYSFLQLCVVGSHWLGLSLFVSFSMIVYYLSRDPESSKLIVEEEKEEKDPFAAMGIAPIKKKKKKAELPSEFRIYYDFYVKKLRKAQEMLCSEDETLASTVKTKPHKGKRKRLKESRAEKVKEVLTKKQQEEALMVSGIEEKYPSPRSPRSRISGNQLDDLVERLDSIELESIDELQEWSGDIFDSTISGDLRSPIQTPRAAPPKEGPGITYGPLNPRVELRGRLRMHLDNSDPEYTDELDSNILNAETDPAHIFADLMDELEVLEWFEKLTAPDGVRFTREMQGPGYSRADRVLRGEGRVKSRTRKNIQFPIVSGALPELTVSDAQAIMSVNALDEAEMEAKEDFVAETVDSNKGNNALRSARPKTSPVRGSFVSSLENSSSILTAISNNKNNKNNSKYLNRLSRTAPGSPSKTSDW